MAIWSRRACGRAMGASAGRPAGLARRSSRSCSPATRSAILRGARCTCTAHRPWPRAARRRCRRSTSSRASRVNSTCGSARSAVRTDRDRADRRHVRRRRLSRGDRRARRRVDLARRLAVPQLDRHRPLPGLPLRRDRAVRRRALSDRAPRATRRGITGKSSGGYGAMVLPMLRPDVFGALASHAGDALFEVLLPARVPQRRANVARPFRWFLRGLLRALAEADHFDFARFGTAAGDATRYAAAYSPDPELPGARAAALRAAHRPARRRRVGAVARARPGADGPRAMPTRSASMRRIYLDAGRSDEPFLTSGHRPSPTS